MNQKERENYLIDYLSQEIHQQFNLSDYCFELYRALVNIREPELIDEEYLKVEDAYLQELTSRKGIVEINCNEPIVIWQGDITRLKVDAIVNAANSQMLGCFSPNHACIDNAIHTFAGVRLRRECYEIMKKQHIPEPTGRVKVTKAYNLPCSYVFHTVGPIVNGRLTNQHRLLLKMCYTSCLEAANRMGLKSIAFCCISTGVFHFPAQEACRIAVETVREFQKNHCLQVVFNVFKNEDLGLYQEEIR